jgi:hypothetical protein
MRFITPVYFQKIKSVYDAETGNYTDEILHEDKRFARVITAEIETLKLFYGDIKQGGLVIRLQRPYTANFDRIIVGGKVYSVESSRQLSPKLFICSEVQSNADN